MDGQLVVCFQGRVVASRTAPPHARLLRGRGIMGVQNGPGVPSAPERVQAEALLRQVDEARLAWHSQQIKEGMQWARQRGQRIGRPRVNERPEFEQRFAAVVQRIGSGGLSRNQVARKLGIGNATLKRLLEASEQASAIKFPSLPSY